MLGRALSLATVTLLAGWFVVSPVWAQTQNLEAGKSPSQIFAGTCTACHKSPRGLLKTVAPGSLPGFLRQHYTTSSDMASTLSSYLVSNGASDPRGGRDKPSTEPKPEARSGTGSDQSADRQGRRMRPGSQEAAKPDADGSAQGEPVRQGRKRLVRPGEGPDETKPAADGQAPAQMGDDRKLSAKRLSKRGKPGAPGGEESPKMDTAKPDTAKPDTAKPDTAKTDESPKAEPAKDDKPKSDTAKEESGKPEGINKPAGEGKPEAAKSEPAPAKIEVPKDNSGAAPVLRADPVPPVTPAPPTSAAPSTAAVSSGAPAQPAAPRPSAPAPTSEPPAVTASAPPPAPPVSNAGPPAPPISQ
jgi:hypothetical protein